MIDIYIIGIIIGLYQLQIEYKFISHNSIFSFNQFISLILFILHNCRRLWECLNITLYGDSKIHIGGYLIGITHYVLVPLSIAAKSDNNNNENNKTTSDKPQQ